MKNLTLLFFLVLSATISNAQIVINSGDMPLIGQEIEQASDTLPNAQIQPGGTGAGSWDFSNLEDHLTVRLRVRPPGEAPLSGLFPTATAAMNFDSGFYQMIQVSPEKLQFLGITGYFPINDSTLSPMAIPNNPPQTIITFPATFGQQFTETVRTAIQLPLGFPFDSIRVTTMNFRTVKIDAYGTMKTPAATFNSLRVREQVVSLDTTYALTPIGWIVLNAPSVPDTNVSYGWWGKINNRAFPLMELAMSPGADEDHVLSATWVKNIDFSPIRELVRHPYSLKISPNPATSEIVVELQEGASGRLQVFDFNGKLVLEKKSFQGAERIEIGNLPQGNYVAIVKSRDGKVIGGQKFEVQR